MAITANFSPGNGLLSVFGDSLGNSITISRDVPGTIRVNGGAVTILGGVATVANTTSIRVFGQAGDDTSSWMRPMARCRPPFCLAAPAMTG